jgi:hypothetical protein
MPTLTSLGTTSKTIARVLNYRKYARVAAAGAVSVALVQFCLLSIAFWVRLGYRAFDVMDGVYIEQNGFLPTLWIPYNSLFWFRGGSATLVVSPMQFFEMMLISVLVGVYASLALFYRSTCAAMCRREVGVGAAGFAVGGALPVATSSAMAVCGGGCGVALVPLLGAASPLLGVGLSAFGFSFPELFNVWSLERSRFSS